MNLLFYKYFKNVLYRHVPWLLSTDYWELLRYAVRNWEHDTTIYDTETMGVVTVQLR